MTSGGKKKINLALQGGGAHGAFAWGILDKLLEDGRLDIDGICATSAGTMNACALAMGMHKGGKEKAREVLHDLWWKIHEAGQQFNPVQRMPWEQIAGYDMRNSLAYFMFDSITRLFSPYDLNPFDMNPLRDIVEEFVDFETLRKCDCVKLFISTTQVRNGKVRVFNTDEMTLDVVMASAALPILYKAVEIDGEDYWDGGYTGNPALFPLFYETNTRDVLVVHLNPVNRPETPVRAPDIMNRINEISFNSSLLKEMRAISFVKRLLDDDMLKDEYKNKFKNVLVHCIQSDKAMCDLSVASKFNSDWDFLTDLRDRGRTMMEDWLKEHYDDVGVRPSVNLEKVFASSTSKVFDNDDSE